MVAASRRSPGDGGKKGRKKPGRRATEADREDGLSVGSGKPPAPALLAPSFLRALRLAWLESLKLHELN